MKKTLRERLLFIVTPILSPIVPVIVGLSLFARPVNAQTRFRPTNTNNELNRTIVLNAPKVVQEAPEKAPEATKKSGVKRYGKRNGGKGHILGGSILNYKGPLSKRLERELKAAKKERFYQNAEAAQQRLKQYSAQSKQEVVEVSQETNTQQLIEIDQTLLQENLSEYGIDQNQLFRDYIEVKNLLMRGGFVGAAFAGNTLKNWVFSKVFRKKQKQADELWDELFKNEEDQKRKRKNLSNAKILGLLAFALVIFYVPIRIPKKNTTFFSKKEESTTIGTAAGKKAQEIFFPPKPTFYQTVLANFFPIFNYLSKNYGKISAIAVLSALLHPGVRSWLFSKTPQLVFVEKSFQTLGKLTKALEKSFEGSLQQLKFYTEYFRKGLETLTLEQKDSLKTAQNKVEKLNTELTNIKVDFGVAKERLDICNSRMGEAEDAVAYWNNAYGSLYDTVRTEYNAYKKSGGNLLPDGSKVPGQLGLPRLLEEIGETREKQEYVPVINVGKNRKKK